MYLLARAQALSGRRRDAVIMLRRLAEAGFANDAATDDDFRRVRELPEWSVVLEIVNRPRPAAPAVPTAVVERAAAPRVVAPAPASPPAAATSAAAPAAAALPLARASVEEAARFSTAPFDPAGLAYDAVSKRFLFGDVTGRRLFVVGEGSDHATDLARAESAGFNDVTAFAIDAKRGELWVVSTATDGQGGALHHLQLISGRTLGKIEVSHRGTVRLSDVAVAGDGTVFVLDSATPRVLALRPGAAVLIELLPLATRAPVSLAVDESGRFAYVAHQEGIARVDILARRAEPMVAAKGLSLAGFEFVRINGSVLVGSQPQPDGSRGLVRLQSNGTRVTAATLIETWPIQEGARSVAAITGNELYYLVAAQSTESKSGPMNVRVRRVRLR